MATQVAKQTAEQQIGRYEMQNQVALGAMRVVPGGDKLASKVEGAEGKLASQVVVCPVCPCHPDGTPKTQQELQADAASEQKKAAVQDVGKQAGAEAVDKAAAGYTGGASETANAASTATGGKTIGGATADGYGDAGNDALKRLGGCPACPCQPAPPAALERGQLRRQLLELLESLARSVEEDA